MTKDKENYGAGYLYAEDLLAGGEFVTVQVVIEQFIPPNTIRAANGKTIDKPALKFVNKTKLLVLCKTNQRLIHWVTGETLGEKSLGKTITLKVRSVDAFGEKVPAIRVWPSGLKIPKSLRDRLGDEAKWEGAK